jgi:hypothetical protein
MITFKSITEIESIRRKIESQQDALNRNRKLARVDLYFDGYAMAAAPAESHQIIREALCELNIRNILLLLDDAQQLGVDVTQEKATLAAALRELGMDREDTPS